MKYKQEKDRTFLRPIFASAIMGAAAYGVYYGMYYLVPVNILALGIAVAVAVPVYFVLVIMLRAVTEEELKSMPKGYLLIKMGRKMRLLK